MVRRQVSCAITARAVKPILYRSPLQQDRELLFPLLVAVCVWALMFRCVTAQTQVCSQALCAWTTGAGGKTQGAIPSSTISGTVLQSLVRTDSRWEWVTVTHAGATAPAQCDFDTRLTCAANPPSWISWGTGADTGNNVCHDARYFGGNLLQLASWCNWEVTVQAGQERTRYRKDLTFTNRAVSGQTRTRTRRITVFIYDEVGISGGAAIDQGDIDLKTALIDASNDQAPTLTLTVWVTVDNPRRVSTASMTLQPTDIIITGAGFTITDLDCATSGNDCVQEITFTSTINTPCPTRQYLDGDQWQIQLTTICNPIDTACPVNSQTHTLTLSLSSASYCSISVVEDITLSIATYTGVDQDLSPAYPNNGGSASTLFQADDFVYFEVSAVADYDLAFDEALLNKVDINGLVIYDVLQPLLDFGVSERTTGFVDSNLKLRFRFDMAKYLAAGAPQIEGEVFNYGDVGPLTVNVVVDTHVLASASVERPPRLLRPEFVPPTGHTHRLQARITRSWDHPVTVQAANPTIGIGSETTIRVYEDTNSIDDLVAARYFHHLLVALSLAQCLGAGVLFGCRGLGSHK